MDERWPGSLFQTLEATDENDFDLAISVFRVGTHSDNEEEDRSDSCWHIPWNKGGEVRWLLELENLESYSSNLEIYSVAKQEANATQRERV